MNLPGGVPAPLLCKLNSMLLLRPITNRLELITVFVCGAPGTRTDSDFSLL